MNLTSLFSFNGTTKEYIEKVKEYFEKQEPPRLNQIDYSYEDPKLDNIYETDLKEEDINYTKVSYDGAQDKTLCMK